MMDSKPGIILKEAVSTAPGCKQLAFIVYGANSSAMLRVIASSDALAAETAA